VEGYRHFINKIWNAARFALMHLNREYTDINDGQLSLPDRWILSRLNRVTRAVAEALDSYRYNDAASALYRFVWHEFCDWYLEAIKPDLYGKTGEDRLEASRSVLWHVLRNMLILLHPFIPFITEEIWHHLPGTNGSIMKAAFPLPGSETAVMTPSADAESAMDLVIGIITGIRNIRGEMNIQPSLSLEVSVQSPDETVCTTIRENQDLIVHLARLKSLVVEPPGVKPRSAATAVAEGATIYVFLEGILDFAKEAARLDKEIGKLEAEIVRVSKKLQNEGFLSNAPGPVIEKVKEKHKALMEKQQKLQVNLDKIKEML